VPYPGPLNLSCDDRPDPESMAGVYAFLFLEKSPDGLWLVDGPDGVHASRRAPSQAETERMRQVVAAVPRSNGAPDVR